MEANQQTDEMLSKDTGTKKFVYDGQEFPDTPYFRNLVKRREEREAKGPGTFKEAAQTIAEVSPVIGDAIAVYNLPSDLRKAYELIQQGYTEGDIKDIGLGAGLAGLSALGVVPVLGTGAKIAKKGLRATIDDALVQTEDLFRTASGMDGPDSMAMATTAPSRITGNTADDKLPDTSITKIIIGKSGKDFPEKAAKYQDAKQKLIPGKNRVEDADAQELWNRTGVQEDLSDGELVYEIPTRNAKFKTELFNDVFEETDGSLKRRNRYPDEEPIFRLEKAPDFQLELQDIVDFEDLFEQAPYLRNIEIKPVGGLGELMGTNAAYDDVNNIIYISKGSKDDLMSSMLHEIEHAVQKADNKTYAGSNVNRYLQGTDYDLKEHNRLRDVRRSISKDMTERLDDVYGENWPHSDIAMRKTLDILSRVRGKKRDKFIEKVLSLEPNEKGRLFAINNTSTVTDYERLAKFRKELGEELNLKLFTSEGDRAGGVNDFDFTSSLHLIRDLAVPRTYSRNPLKRKPMEVEGDPLKLVTQAADSPDLADLARFDDLKAQAIIKYMRDPGEVTSRNVQFRFLASKADPSIVRVVPRLTEDKSVLPGVNQAAKPLKYAETKTGPQLQEEAAQSGVTLTEEGYYLSTPDELARAKGASNVAEQTSEAIPVMPINQAGLEARGFDFKPGGEYVNPITKEILTGKKVGNANIKIVPGMEIRGGRPMAEFNVTDLDVPEVGSTGKGKTQILVNLIKPTKKGNKAGWAWDDVESKELEGVNTLVSVVHKGKHYFTLETDFSKGAELKTYPKSQSEPRLRPTAMGEIDLQEQVGTIRMKNKTHPVYRKITAFASGGLAMAKGGAIPMDRQMDMFDDGGLMDQGGSTDPVSGNDVPVGSLQEEVRDDIPAMLSEGEFVMPADVVRYHGLDKMMALRDEAKLGLARMEAMGQMGNAEEAIIPPDIPFGLEDLDIADDPLEMQVGGFVPQQQPYGTITQPGGQNVFSVPSQFQPQPIFAPFNQQQFAPAAPVTPVFGPGQPTGQPKETFTFDQLMPTSGGVSETREYRNAEGKSLYIPFINGEPVYPIPEGYTEYKPDATPDPTPDPVTTTTAAAPKEEDPSDGRELGGGPAGLTMNQSRISILSQLDDEFANKISGINKKYEAPSGLGAFSIVGNLGREFKKGSETRAALKDYDYDKLAKSRGLTREELDSTLQELTSEIYSGYRDPVTGEVKGQKDPRSLFQRAGDFVGGVEPSGDGDDLGTAPTTARVETTLEATQEAGVTASGAAKENVKALNDIMNELKIPENQKMDYLVKAAAGQGAQTFVTGPDRANTIRVDFSTFTPEVSAAAQDVLDVIGTRGDDRLKSMLTSSQEVAQAEVRPTAAASIYKEPDPAGDILPGEPGSDTAFDPVRQEEEDRQTQNYISKGYDEPRAKAAAKNKVAADNIAKQQARDRGESEEHIAKTTAVTDSSGKPVTTTSAVTGKTTVVTNEPEKDDPGPSKIVCTEMYRQTQLDDWKQAIKIWGVYEKKYLTPYHEKGYHWLFKPWVRGMQHSSVLTSVGAYLAKARTQHLKHVMTKGKAPDSFVGNVWCKIIHPIVYIAGRTKEWLKLQKNLNKK